MTYTIQLPTPSTIKHKIATYRYPGDVTKYSGERSSSEFEKQYTILNYTPENPKLLRTSLSRVSSYSFDLVSGILHNPSIYRSVILDTATNTPLSFSPVKSIPFSEFSEKYPTLVKDIQITEMMEGTMINLFYDKMVGCWQIATKNVIGGHNRFFVNLNHTPSETIAKTFRQMFYDALRADYSTELSDIPFIANLDQNAVYSFVLQHPENHIVFRIEHPLLILVSIFVISLSNEEENTYNVKLVPQHEFIDIIPDLYTYSGIVDLPKYNVEPSWISTSTLEYTDYGNTKGLVITNIATGERTKLDNPEYLKRKELRGNHPHLHYQYLALMRIGKVHDFLHYYPMYSHMFHQFYTQYHTFITDVHQAYVSYYIHRKTDAPIPKRLFIHAARIHHTIYIPSLSTAQKTIIKHKVVREYFDKMDPREILFSMYYNEPK